MGSKAKSDWFNTPEAVEILAAAERYYSDDRNAYIDLLRLADGAYNGFASIEVRSIMWDRDAWEFIADILEDYQVHFGGELPPLMESVMLKELGSNAPKWNTVLLGRIGHLPNWSWSLWNDAVQSLPEGFRKQFDWDNLPGVPVDIQALLTAEGEAGVRQGDFALAAGGESGSATGSATAIRRDLDPAKFDRIWRAGGFQVGVKVVSENVLLITVYSTVDVTVDLILTWLDGFAITVEDVNLTKGATSEDRLVEGHGNEPPNKLVIKGRVKARAR